MDAVVVKKNGKFFFEIWEKNEQIIQHELSLFQVIDTVRSGLRILSDDHITRILNESS